MSLTKSNFRSGNIFAWLGLSLMHYWDHWWFEGWWVGEWTISGGGGIQPEGLPRVCCFGPRQLLQEWWVGQLFIPIKPKVTYRTFCKKKRHFDKEVAVSYFLVILVRKSSIGWWLHISRCVDYKQCSGGPNWPNQVPILVNLTCQYKFWAGKPKKTFFRPHKRPFSGFSWIVKIRDYPLVLKIHVFDSEIHQIHDGNNEILHMETWNLWDLQKKIGLNCPFLAPRLADTIYTPS